MRRPPSATAAHRQLPRSAAPPGFFREVEAAGVIGRFGELVQPLPVDGVALGTGEAEIQGNRVVQPDTASTIAHCAVVAPGEEEPLSSAQLRRDHDLEVGEGSVVDIDLAPGIPVQQLSQRCRPSLRRAPGELGKIVTECVVVIVALCIVDIRLRIDRLRVGA